MTKRERTAPGGIAAAAAEEAEAKQRKLDGQQQQQQQQQQGETDPEEIIRPFMNDLDKIQKTLQDLDEQCARKQMEVQKEFDLAKKPIIKNRQALINKIPGFWCTAIRNHHMLALMSDADEPVLRYLKSIELDDNLDDAGSYRIKFVFAEGAKAYFTPLELIKEVRFGTPGPADEEVVEATEINWLDKEKNPVSIVTAEREKVGDDEAAPWSFFEWFTKEQWPEERPDVGEVVRREIWHSPVAYFLGDSLSEEGAEGLSEEIDDSESDNDNEEEE